MNLLIIMLIIINKFVDNIYKRYDYVVKRGGISMKWLKKAILAIFMLLTIFQSYPQCMLITSGYNKIYSQISIVDKVYKSKNDYLKIDVVIPQIKDDKSVDKAQNVNNSIIIWTEAWINDVKNIADEYFKNGTSPINQYQLISKYKVTSLQNVISLYIDYYQYTGGAHGITIRKPYNIDEETGMILTLKDIFREGYDYKEIIDSNIIEQISKKPDIYFSGKEGFNGIDEKTKFYIEDSNLIIYYGEYEIAPYVTGIPEFHIPINIFKGNFKYDKI